MPHSPAKTACTGIYALRRRVSTGQLGNGQSFGYTVPSELQFFTHTTTKKGEIW